MARPNLNEEEREQRRTQLLAAAHSLFTATGELPSVAAIAQAAGVAKGSVYLSYGSKEEIFVSLLEDNFSALFSLVVPGVHLLSASREEAAGQFSALYADAVVRTPELLPLAGMTNAVLEKNLPLPAMLAFKERLAGGLEMAADALARSALALERQTGIDLLLRTWSMTLGLWQSLNFPGELRPHLQRAPLDVFARDFHGELAQAVRAIWVGTLAASTA